MCAESHLPRTKQQWHGPSSASFHPSPWGRRCRMKPRGSAEGYLNVSYPTLYNTWHEFIPSILGIYGGWVSEWKLLSRIWLFATPWTIHTVHGILQARILEWVAVPFSRGSFQPWDRTHVSNTAGGFFTSSATRESSITLPIFNKRKFRLGYYVFSVKK